MRKERTEKKLTDYWMDWSLERAGLELGTEFEDERAIDTQNY